VLHFVGADDDYIARAFGAPLRDVGARLLALGPWHAMARHDGPLSVLRAYTLAEVRALTTAAGLARARVETRPPFRMIIVVQKSCASAKLS